MNLKEFDAKQFLLEKGEQVGLGVALTLMVLILILSLFWPSKGFFSGSPAGKASELNSSTKQLADALTSRQPGDRDKPEQREGKLINLDTGFLRTDDYATAMWFEPAMRENKARRPPKIYNMDEAIASVVQVPIDTYRFLGGQSPKVLVLEDKNNKGLGGANSLFGQNNPLNQMLRSMPSAGGGGRGGSSAMGGSNNPMLRQQQSLFGPGGLQGINQLQGAADNTDYKAVWLPLDEWNPDQQKTAHVLQPLRMAIIAGSFPYKKQIEEHQKQLRLKTTDDVLKETIGEGDKQSSAFDFLGVVVERVEVDAEGKELGEWSDPQLKESYQLWLQATYLPFESEDPKYDPVRPNDGNGLVMPLLREFHANRATAPGLSGMQLPGMMQSGRGMMQPNMLRPSANQQQPAADEKPSTHYPDVAAKLDHIKKTLDAIEEAKPKVFAQARKFQRAAEGLNPFVRSSALPVDKNQNQAAPSSTTQTNASGEGYVPEYVLVRVVDVHVEPGKYYRYRFKIKMANPNYQKPDVASPEYKEKDSLESSEWYTMPEIVKVPQELFYYVVDESQGLRLSDINKTTPRESAQYRLLTARTPTPSGEQVALQFQRWVETTQQSRKDTEQIPVGEWAVADRVFVARGEYIGRKVNVDIPIWKYTQNTFILPTEDQKLNKKVLKMNTGIDVDFGQESAENNLILVDFEGGKGTSLPSNSKIRDDCAVEVLMLSPDGKLLARNSSNDTIDQARITRREEVYKRVQQVREGKATD